MSTTFITGTRPPKSAKANSRESQLRADLDKLQAAADAWTPERLRRAVHEAVEPVRRAVDDQLRRQAMRERRTATVHRAVNQHLYRLPNAG